MFGLLGISLVLLYLCPLLACPAFAFHKNEHAVRVLLSHTRKMCMLFAKLCNMPFGEIVCVSRSRTVTPKHIHTRRKKKPPRAAHRTQTILGTKKNEEEAFHYAFVRQRKRRALAQIFVLFVPKTGRENARRNSVYTTTVLCLFDLFCFSDFAGRSRSRAIQALPTFASGRRRRPERAAATKKFPFQCYVMQSRVCTLGEPRARGRCCSLRVP